MAIRWSHVVIVATGVGLAGSLGCSRPVGSYGDCVLAHVTTGMEETAVSAVTRACRDKFPADAGEPADATAVALDDEALSRIAFRRYGGDQGPTVLGVLYNGNPDVTLTEVDVSYTTSLEGREDTHVYRTRTSVTPYGTRSLQLTVLAGDRGAPSSATIVGARGRPAQ